MADNGEKLRFPLDAHTLQRLDTLALQARRPMATGRPGRRRSPLAGSSMEFSISAVTRPETTSAASTGVPTHAWNASSYASLKPKKILRSRSL